jgi:hypothetical protein
VRAQGAARAVPQEREREGEESADAGTRRPWGVEDAASGMLGADGEGSGEAGAREVGPRGGRKVLSKGLVV